MPSEGGDESLIHRLPTKGRNENEVFIECRALASSTTMNFSHTTKNPTQTKRLAAILAKEILKTKNQKRALVLGLKGDLGGGKTTFLQGLAKGLGIKKKILSPTFVIMKKFLISHSQFLNFYHIDCYRIKKSKEILDLGFKDIISNPQNIVVVEWADRIKKIMPKNTIRVNFKFINKNERKITINYY